MITLYDLITIISTLVGIMIGMIIGKEYGIGLGIAGAIAGGYIGWRLGILPTRLMIRKQRRNLAKLTVDELHQQLHKPLLSDGHTPNFLLLELRARGEDISKHVDMVLNLMEAESFLRRSVGFAALLSAYPQLARRMRPYNPNWSVERCRQCVAELRKMISSGN
jgi:hypothetical protein